VAFIFPFLVYLLTLNSGGGQSGNIVGMQSSIIQMHSLNIVQSGIDLVSYHGKLYSVYAPGLGFLSLPFSLLGFMNYSLFLGYTENAAIADEIFVSICAAMTGIIVYRFCRFYCGRIPSLATSMALTLGTSVLPFAVSVFPHDVSLLFSCTAVYLVVLNARTTAQRDSTLILAGISLGIAALTEYASALFVVPLFLYILFEKKRIRRVVSALMFASFFVIIGVGLNLLYNYELFGNALVFPQMLFAYGVHFTLGIDLAEHLLFYLVSPFRGVLFLSPILILGVIGLGRMINSPSSRADAALFTALFLSIAIYYSAWQGWDGAWAYGPRFLIIGLPYLAIPISVLISKNQLNYTFLILFSLSSFTQLAGAVTGPSSPGRNDPLLFQLTSYALPNLLKGSTATLLIGTNTPFVAVLFFLSLFLVIFLSLFEIVSRPRVDERSESKTISVEYTI